VQESGGDVVNEFSDMVIRRIRKCASGKPAVLETDYESFVSALQNLLNIYGIAIESVGGIKTFDPNQPEVVYTRDIQGG
jgi:hypothetical protein